MADESKFRAPRSDSAVSGGRPRSDKGGDPLAELARLIGQDDLFEQMRRDAARAGNPAVAPQAPIPVASRSAPEPVSFESAAPEPLAPEPPAFFQASSGLEASRFGPDADAGSSRHRASFEPPEQPFGGASSRGEPAYPAPRPAVPRFFDPEPPARSSIPPMPYADNGRRHDDVRYPEETRFGDSRYEAARREEARRLAQDQRDQELRELQRRTAAVADPDYEAVAHAAGYDAASGQVRQDDQDYDAPHGHAGEAYASQAYDDPAHAGAEQADQAYAGQPYVDPADAAPVYDERAYDERAYEGQAYQDQAYQDQAYQDQAYQDQAYDDRPYGGQAYEGYADDPEGAAAPRRSRRGLAAVGLVAGLAVLGTAGAFGYWAVSSGGDGEPPLIAASGTPSKVAPKGQGERTAGIGFNRSGASGPERVVSREEQPVELQAVRTAAPRMMGGSGSPGTMGLTTGSTSAAAPAAAGAGDLDEPRRVRTVAVRPDGTMVQQPAQGAAQGQASARQPAAPQGAPQGGTPWSDVPVPGGQTRTAALTPPAATPEAARPAGTHVVQVASQRTEREAESSFRALQRKYPGVLGSHEPMIRSVDLGERGTFYRVQIGPFASSDQANNVCGSLRSAGGQCIVQRY